MKQLTPQQVEAANLYLARKANGMTLEQIGETVGVTRRTLYTWTQLPEFKAYIHESTVEVAKSHLDDVLANLVKLATKTGNVKAIDTYLKVVGLLGNENVKVEVTNNVEDRSTEAINADIERLREQLGMTVEAPKKQLTRQDIADLEIETLKKQLKEFDLQ